MTASVAPAGTGAEGLAELKAAADADYEEARNNYVVVDRRCKAEMKAASGWLHRAHDRWASARAALASSPSARPDLAGDAPTVEGGRG